MAIEVEDGAATAQPIPAVWRAEDLLQGPDDRFPDPPLRSGASEIKNLVSKGGLHVWLSDEDILFTSDLFLCMNANPPGDTRTVWPDCMVAFGVKREWSLEDRNAYVIGEVGRPPDFVLEVASATAGDADYARKRQIYMDFQVPEIFRFDPTGGEIFDAALAGERLVRGEYVSLPLIYCPKNAADEALHVESEMLGLDICWHNGRMRFYVPAGDRHLDGWVETEKARLKAEARAETARDQIEAARAMTDAAQAMTDAAMAHADAAMAHVEEDVERARAAEVRAQAAEAIAAATRAKAQKILDNLGPILGE